MWNGDFNAEGTKGVEKETRGGLANADSSLGLEHDKGERCDGEACFNPVESRIAFE